MILENKHLLHYIYIPLPFIALLFFVVLPGFALPGSDLNQAYQFEQTHKTKKPKPVLKYDSAVTIQAPFEGTQGYMAIRGNNFFTGLSDFIITYSLNSESGTLLNKQKTLATIQSNSASSAFNFSTILPSGLPSSLYNESIQQIAWTVINGTAYLAVRGYITGQNPYIALYTLDASTGTLANKNSLTLPLTEPITDMQWVVVNNSAFLTLYGVDTQYSRPFITIYSLIEQTASLSNKQKILLSSQESINQITWVVVQNIAYLGLWGLDTSLNKYFITLYTLNSSIGSLTNQQKTLLNSSESMTQIEWTVVNNNAYLGVDAYDTLSTRSLIAVYRLNQSTGKFDTRQVTYLPKGESCPQIAWVVVNNNAYLGFWGFNSLKQKYFVSSFTLNTTTLKLENRNTTLIALGNMINAILWIVIDQTAFLAAPGFDSYRGKNFVMLYTLDATNNTLGNQQVYFLDIQKSITQSEWVIVQNTAFLGLRGFDNLNNRFYIIVYTLNSLDGILYNKNNYLSTGTDAYYGFEWVAL